MHACLCARVCVVLTTLFVCDSNVCGSVCARVRAPLFKENKEVQDRIVR